jgi:hypothetical protein
LLNWARIPVQISPPCMFATCLSSADIIINVVVTVFRWPTPLPVFLAHFYVFFFSSSLSKTVFRWIHQPTCLCTLTIVFVWAQFLEWYNSWS